VLLPEKFLKAPPKLIPLPFNVNASALIEVVISKAAPFATVVPEPVVPRAEAFEARNTPADIVVAPV
jgi:hypothetical protein